MGSRIPVWQITYLHLLKLEKQRYHLPSIVTNLLGSIQQCVSLTSYVSPAHTHTHKHKHKHTLYGRSCKVFLELVARISSSSALHCYDPEWFALAQQHDSEIRHQMLSYPVLTYSMEVPKSFILYHYTNNSNLPEPRVSSRKAQVGRGSSTSTAPEIAIASRH